MKQLTNEAARAALDAACGILHGNLAEFTDKFQSSNSEHNFYPPSDNVEWTTGFCTGEYWLAWEHTRDDAFKTAALRQVDSFLDRIEREDKHWKLSTADMKERALWAEYDAAYEDCINATATEHAPWYVLPADDKWYTRYLVSEILLDTLTEMKPEFPPLSATEMALVPSVKAELESGK